tara:strand:- start:55 stop:174 length:120 start_codon:yes stop_codon:yes gene_type:complete
MSHIGNDILKELIFEQLQEELGREPTESEVMELLNKKEG